MITAIVHYQLGDPFVTVSRCGPETDQAVMLQLNNGKAEGTRVPIKSFAAPLATVLYCHDRTAQDRNAMDVLAHICRACPGLHTLHYTDCTEPEITVGGIRRTNPFVDMHLATTRFRWCEFNNIHTTAGGDLVARLAVDATEITFDRLASDAIRSHHVFGACDRLTLNLARVFLPDKSIQQLLNSCPYATILTLRSYSGKLEQLQHPCMREIYIPVWEAEQGDRTRVNIEPLRKQFPALQMCSLGEKRA